MMNLPLPPQQLLDALPVAVFVVDADGRPVYANAASVQLLGRGAVPGVTPAGLGHVLAARVAGTDLAYPPEKTPLMRALGGETCTVDDMEIVQGRQRRALEVWGAPVRDADGQITHAIAAYHDVTARKAAEATVARLRCVDPVTGLPDRAALETTFAAALDRMGRRPGHGVAAILLHVERFETLSVRHGTDIGDELLVCLAERLRDSIRRVDHGHRLGPSHFMVVAENVRSKAQAQRLARRLADDISGTFETSQGLVTMHVTPGVSFTQDPAARPGRMTREADQDALVEELSGT